MSLSDIKKYVETSSFDVGAQRPYVVFCTICEAYMMKRLTTHDLCHADNRRDAIGNRFTQCWICKEEPALQIVGLSTIHLVLGEAYAPLLSIAASVLATSMASPGDVATTFHALPLARALFAESTAIGCSSTWEGALAEAERFLESRPEEVEPLVQIERSAATSSASMRRAAGRGSAAMKGAGVLLARRRASTAATS